MAEPKEDPFAAFVATDEPEAPTPEPAEDPFAAFVAEEDPFEDFVVPAPQAGPPEGTTTEKEEAEKDAYVQMVFDAVEGKDITKQNGILALYRAGIPWKIAEDGYQTLRDTKARADNDPRAWREGNPMLHKWMIEDPRRASMAKGDENISLFNSALRYVGAEASVAGIENIMDIVPISVPHNVLKNAVNFAEMVGFIEAPSDNPEIQAQKERMAKKYLLASGLPEEVLFEEEAIEAEGRAEVGITTEEGVELGIGAEEGDEGEPTEDAEVGITTEAGVELGIGEEETEEQAALAEFREKAGPLQVSVQENPARGLDMLTDAYRRGADGGRLSDLGAQQQILNNEVHDARERGDPKEIEKAEAAAFENLGRVRKLQDSIGVQQNYEQGELGQLGLEFAGVVASQVDSISAAIAGAGIVGAAGAVAGGVGGFAVAGPGGILPGAAAVAPQAAQFGTMLFAYGQSYRREKGSLYLDLMDATDDQGNPLDRDVVNYVTWIGGHLKAGVELAELGIQLETMGLGGLLTRGASPSKVLSKALTGKFGLALATAAKRYAKGSLAEGAQEGTQTAIDVGADYVARVFSAAELLATGEGGTPVGIAGALLAATPLGAVIHGAALLPQNLRLASEFSQRVGAAADTQFFDLGGGAAKVGEAVGTGTLAGFGSAAVGSVTIPARAAITERVAPVVQSIFAPKKPATPKLPVALAVASMEEEAASDTAVRMHALTELAGTETAKENPQDVARLAEIATQGTGGKVTKVFVDPARLAEALGSPQAVEALLGEGGKERLSRATQERGDISGLRSTLEVSVEEFLVWPKEVVNKIKEDLTDNPKVRTAREQKFFQDEIDTLATKVAEETTVETTEEAEAISPAEKRFAEALTAQLVDTKQATKSQAKQMVSYWRAWIRTSMKHDPEVAQQMFERMTAFVQTEVTATVPEASQHLTRRLEGLDPTGRAQELFIDRNTELYNERGFLFDLETNEDKFLVRYKVEGTKWKNNEGHTPGNELYRVSAQALAAAAPNGAKWGGDFAATAATQQAAIESGKLMQEGIRDRLRELNPDIAEQIEGLEVIVSVVPRNADNIAAAWKEAGDVGAAEAEGLEAAGKRAERGTRPQGIPVEDPAALRLSPDPAKTRMVPQEMIDRAASMTDEQVFTAAYINPMTGMLTREAFFALPKKDHVISMDLNGLKAINLKYGDEKGDLFIRRFADLAKAMGASEMDFAHLSGDEFAAQTNDSDLAQFFVDILAEAALLFEQDGATLSFGYGIDENYDKADAKVTPQKLLEKAEPGTEAEARARRAVDWRSADRRTGAKPLARGGRGQELARPGERDRDSQRQARSRAAAKRAAAQARVQALAALDPREVAKALLAADSAEATAATDVTTDSLLPEGAVDDVSFYQPIPPPEGALDQPKRGYIKIVRDGVETAFKIFLTEKADLSTFLHESSHAFLVMMGDLAADPDSSLRVKRSHETALKFLGAEPGVEFTTAQQEKWAQQFEAYIRVGKAPAAGLVEAFATTRHWLNQIYQGLNTAQTALDPDIREVFDQMLATDREIEKMQMASGRHAPMWKSHIEADMTPAKWAEYTNKRIAATSSAVMAVQRQAAAAKLRAAKAFKSHEFKRMKKEAEAEWYDRPDVLADRFLRLGEMVLEDGQIVKDKALGKLDRAQVRLILGEDSSFEKSRNTRLAKDGADPAAVAQQFGFDSAEALLDAISSLPDQKEWTSNRAKALTREANPEIDGEIADFSRLVEESVHNEISRDVFLEEITSLGRKKGANNKAAKETIDAAAKKAAKIIVGRKSVRRLGTGQVLAQERSLARQAAVAINKGQLNHARELLIKRLAMQHVHTELTQAVKDRDKFKALAKGLTKRKTRAAFGKTPDNKISLDVMDTVTENLGFVEPRKQDLDKPRADLGDLLAEMENSGSTIGFDIDLLKSIMQRPREWKSLSVDQMRAVGDALVALRKNANHNKYVMIDGKRTERALVREAMVETFNQSPLTWDKQTRETAKGILRLFQVTGHVLEVGDAYLLKPQMMMGFLGNFDQDSIVHKAVMQKLQESKQKESDMMNEVVKPVVDAFDNIPLKVRKRLQDPVDGHKLFPNHKTDILVGPPSTRLEVLMMVAHRGNESSLQRLTEGRGITVQEVDAALGMLTKEELNWAQAVVDSVNRLWAPSRDLAKRDTGLAPPKIEATPFVVETADGPVQMKGGYFPAVYDRHSPAGEKQLEASVGSILGPSTYRVGTHQSRLKSRVKEFSGVLSLDPDIIMKHIRDSVHDITFRENLRDVATLILHKDVQQAMKVRLGDERTDVFKKWLEDIGGTNRARQSTPSRWMQAQKSRAVVGTLGHAVHIVIADVTNVAVAPITTKLKARHAASGLASYLNTPRKVRAFAVKNSGEVRFRARGLKEDVDRKMKSMKASQNLPARAMRWFKDNAFWMAEKMDEQVTTAVWTGAYRQAKIHEGRSHPDAVQFANIVLQESLPSFHDVDKAAFARDKGAAGAIIAYAGYINVLYNGYRRIAQPVITAEGAGAKAKLAPEAVFRMLMLAAVSNVMAELMMGHGPEEEDGETKGERWATWFGRKMLLAPMATIPVVGGAVVGGIEYGLGIGYTPSIRTQASLAAVNLVWKTARETWATGGDGERAAWKVLRAAGIITGHPVGMLKQAEYIYNAIEGDKEVDTSPVGVASGLVRGEREGQALDLFTGIRDIVE